MKKVWVFVCSCTNFKANFVPLSWSNHLPAFADISSHSIKTNVCVCVCVDSALFPVLFAYFCIRFQMVLKKLTTHVPPTRPTVLIASLFIKIRFLLWCAAFGVDFVSRSKHFRLNQFPETWTVVVTCKKNTQLANFVSNMLNRKNELNFALSFLCMKDWLVRK